MNLEDAHLRDESNIVTQDHVLDLLVRPDRSVTWKDEDELEAAVAAGRYSAEDAELFGGDARAVEAIVVMWGSPFCDGWERWKSDPSWPVPALPAGLVPDYG